MGCQTDNARRTFKHPNMKVADMKSNVESQMKKQEIHSTAIQKAIDLLPSLKRWKNKKLI